MLGMKFNTAAWSMLIIMATGLFGCKKTVSPAPPPPPTTDTTPVFQPPVDPAVASTIGFFLNDWQAKTFTAPAYSDTAMPAYTTNTITVNPSSIITKVPSTLFGNN